MRCSPITGIDPRLDEIIRRALEKEPSARYQRMDEVESALRQLKGLDGAAGLEAGLGGRWRGVKRGWVVLSGIILLGGTAGVIGYLAFWPGEKETPSQVKRLVVLPFENLGPADNEYFTDGMTEELTSRLSSLRNLRVISRTSAVQYAKTDKPLEQITRELGVDFVLEGAVRWAPSPGEGAACASIRTSRARPTRQRSGRRHTTV